MRKGKEREREKNGKTEGKETRSATRAAKKKRHTRKSKVPQNPPKKRYAAKSKDRNSITTTSISTTLNSSTWQCTLQGDRRGHRGAGRCCRRDRAPPHHRTHLHLPPHSPPLPLSKRRAPRRRSVACDPLESPRSMRPRQTGELDHTPRDGPPRARSRSQSARSPAALPVGRARSRGGTGPGEIRGVRGGRPEGRRERLAPSDEAPSRGGDAATLTSPAASRALPRNAQHRIWRPTRALRGDGPPIARRAPSRLDTARHGQIRRGGRRGASAPAADAQPPAGASRVRVAIWVQKTHLDGGFRSDAFPSDEACGSARSALRSVWPHWPARGVPTLAPSSEQTCAIGSETSPLEMHVRDPAAPRGSALDVCAVARVERDGGEETRMPERGRAWRSLGGAEGKRAGTEGRKGGEARARSGRDAGERGDGGRRTDKKRATLARPTPATSTVSFLTPHPCALHGAHDPRRAADGGRRRGNDM